MAGIVVENIVGGAIGTALYEAGKSAYNAVKTDIVQGVQEEGKAIYEGGKRRLEEFAQKEYREIKKKLKGEGYEKAVVVFGSGKRDYRREYEQWLAENEHSLGGFVDQNEIEYISRPMITFGGMTDETEHGFVPTLKFSVISKKMPYGKKRSKSSKYVTKRGVKRIIKNYTTLVGDIEYVRQASLFVRTAYLTAPTGGGFSPIGVGDLQFGKRAITSWTWDHRNAWFDQATSYRERLQALIPQPPFGGMDQLPKEDVQTVTKGKGYVEFQIHNPMNEIVQANFWWLMYKEDVSNSPEFIWSSAYSQRQPLSSATVVIPFEEAFFDYPSKYEEFNKYFKIKKKFVMVFQPGETKKLKLTLPKNRLSEVDVPNETYLGGITHNLMVEIMGVPTGDVSGGPPAVYQPGAINFTPASLELIYFYRTKIGMASNDVKFQGYYGDTRQAITSANSLIPQVSAAIGEQ